MDKKHFVILTFLFCMLAVRAQYLQVPYFCGFEDAVENANWTSITSTQNDWMVGGAEKLEGDSGIYVAYQSGTQEIVGTNASSNYMSLYRVVTLEERNVYEISFDWKNPGYGNGEMYVCWIPDEDEIPLYSSTVYDMPSWVKNYVVVQNDTILTGAPIWQNMTFEVVGTGMPHKLLFFFRSKGTSSHPSGRTYPAACLDNIQIAKKLTCLRPRNLTYEQLDASRGLFSWEGDLGPFELKYKGINEETWQVARNLTDFNTSTLKYELPVRPLRKGGYIAKVRQICEGDTSIWSVFPNILVHYSDNNCLDFLDLNGPNVECYLGNFDNPFLSGAREPLDYGFSTAKSRQTIHYVDDEYDPRTNYKLETTPPDGMPSVRLGNWNINAEAEAITYTYPVSADAPLLLLKYAIVLEDPNHDEANQPRFEMIITDGEGNEVDELLCGQANFAADKNDPAWEWGQGGSDSQVIFKNWTSTGLNLQNFIGQNIKITLTTRDCAQTGHYGYAYFTMDCMGAKITGVGCGDNMFGKIEAPEGFKYKWYPKDIKDGLDENAAEQAVQDWFNQPNFADTLQSFTPPGGTSDDGIYVCRIFSIDAPDCWFELEANLDPRDVFAEAESELTIENCEAKVSFTNSSYTKTRNRGDIGACEVFEWDFGNGIKSNEEHPTVVFEPGQTYYVSMKASISEGLCSDEWFDTIVVPDFGPSIDTIHAHTCTNNPAYEFEGVTYTTTGIRTKEFKSIYGCDSIRVLDLVVSEEIKIEYSDTITTEDVYDFYGQTPTETGTYTAELPGQNGECDTLVTLHLLVRPVLHVNFDTENLPDICQGDPDFTWTYSVRTGTLETYDLIFNDKAHNVGFEDQLDVPHIDGNITISLSEEAKPDRYGARLEFDGDTTGIEVFDFEFDVYYSASILQQKWNDVIAIYNTENNGGYEFSAFSWYVDGNEIPGMTGPIFYDSSKGLQIGSSYQAKLTRADDGVTAFTCPIYIVGKSENVEVYPTSAPKRSAVTISMPQEGQISVWDVMGNRISDGLLEAGLNHFSMPERVGTYVFKVLTVDGQSVNVRVMVTE